MNIKPFISNAQWPADTLLGSHDDVSSDGHHTYAEAYNVCTMLEDQGFGGEGKVFPIRTWVSEPNHGRDSNE